MLSHSAPIKPNDKLINQSINKVRRNKALNGGNHPFSCCCGQASAACHPQHMPPLVWHLEEHLWHLCLHLPTLGTTACRDVWCHRWVHRAGHVVGGVPQTCLKHMRPFQYHSILFKSDLLTGQVFCLAETAFLNSIFIHYTFCFVFLVFVINEVKFHA